MDEIDQRMIEHKNDFDRFKKKMPNQIDFSETNWRDKSVLDKSIKIKIKERENDLENIKSSYNKLENVDDFKMKINASQISNGSYLLEIRLSTGVLYRKVIKV